MIVENRSTTDVYKRQGEVFVPPKKDTAIQVKTSLEYATDTVINAVSYTHLLLSVCLLLVGT